MNWYEKENTEEAMLVKKIVENLQGTQRLFWLSALKKLLSNSEIIDDNRARKIWCEINIPKFSKADLIDRLRKESTVTDKAMEFLLGENFKLSGERKIQLVKITLPTLEALNGEPLSDFFTEVLNLGLKPCPPDVAPFLLLETNYLLENDWLNVTVNITDKNSAPVFFSMGVLLGRKTITVMDFSPLELSGSKVEWVFRI